MRVAVIDSGVNPDHPHIRSVSGGVAIDDGGSYDTAPQAYLDMLGHGTAVMAAVQEKAPAAEYFAVRLFRTALSAKATSLFAAIEWCIDHEMDVINLSLGTSNPQHATKLATLVDRSAERGIVLVSAREANGQKYFPGCLPRVIGVELDWNCSRDGYRAENRPEGVVFYASGYPRPVPGVPPERNLNGISFAVANMTGFVIRACVSSAQRTPEVIRTELISGASRNTD